MLLISFVLAITIIVTILLQLISRTILDKNYVIAKLEQTNYYYETYQYVMSNFEKYIHPSGLDESVLENIITEEQIKQDTNKILANLYENAKQPITTEQIEAKLSSQIQIYLATHNVSATQEALDDFIQTIAREYKNSISHYEYEENVNKGYVKLLKTIKKAKRLVSVSMSVAIIILVLINLKSKYQFFVYSGVASFAVGGFLLILEKYIQNNIDVKNILILNQAFSNVLTNCAGQLLHFLFQYSLIFIISGMLLIILPNFMHILKASDGPQKN